MSIIKVFKIKLIIFFLHALPSVTSANPVTVKAAEWTKVENVKQCIDGNCTGSQSFLHGSYLKRHNLSIFRHIQLLYKFVLQSILKTSD